jgi:hypothetical protein
MGVRSGAQRPSAGSWCQILMVRVERATLCKRRYMGSTAGASPAPALAIPVLPKRLSGPDDGLVQDT